MDDECNAYAMETLWASGVLIMGRRTCELMAVYWLTAVLGAMQRCRRLSQHISTIGIGKRLCYDLKLVLVDDIADGARLQHPN